MRIDLVTYGSEPSENHGASRAGQAPPAAVLAGSEGAVDQTRFSFDQTHTHSLEAQVLKQPEVRQPRVVRLEKLLREGRYTVSAAKITHSMVAELAGAVPAGR